MPAKRKRRRVRQADEGDRKRSKISGSEPGQGPIIQHAVLAQYYAQVATLREYLLSRLPTASKVRRRRIRTIGRKPRGADGGEEERLSDFLDHTIIGSCREVSVSSAERWQQWTTFSQRADESASTLTNLSGSAAPYSQSEIVDFVIWLLFSKPGFSNNKNSHLLCQGYRKDTARFIAQTDGVVSTIPGISSTYPNSHVTSLKSWPWPQVLALLGREGEKAMVDLILDCGIFVRVTSGQGIYNQLSGRPLGDLKALTRQKDCQEPQNPETTVSRGASEISFVRHRLLYGRAAINSHGGVRFGLRHIHALNRHILKASEDVVINEEANGSPPKIQRSTLNIMLYVFPRQFCLHNVFTSDVDASLTVQPFQDYTVREDEIERRFPAPDIPKIPKRLRGKLVHLIRKMQVHHSRCPYKHLLEYYCPVAIDSDYTLDGAISQSDESLKLTTQNPVNLPNMAAELPPESESSTRKQSLMNHATPTSMVSAFCKAVLSHVVPHELWGAGDTQAHNRQTFAQNVDRFVELRRFENLSLHEVSQGLKIGPIEWLGPGKASANNLSQSDFGKRWEIFLEFLYYLFDSFLIPLIRTNFHVTESNVNRYRLYYFRHDVWKALTEPVFTTLKDSMFEEIKLQHALNILDSRTLSYSHVRLLPKQSGIRPIMNLRRRPMRNGFLGPSINSVLAPVYNVLTHEKNTNRHRLGSALFSVGELYTRLRQFKSKLSTTSGPLFFAKLDIQAAFDTIPQAAVVDLIGSIPSESEFRVSKHTEIKPGENYRSDTTSKPVRKFTALAHGLDDFEPFEEKLESELAVGRKNVVFVENIVNQFRHTDELLDLLSEHVTNNMVKIGRKYYRQKEGIPQGSVLSSLLCNYFYADLEANHLGFLDPGESLLLRLIDDFLLITPNRSHVRQFLQIMHDGIPEYGARVNPEKTLVNFEVQINGQKVSRVLGQKDFPYCGSFIDTQTLDVRKDRERRKDLAVSDSLTVEFSRVPGKTFHRKVLNTFKIQAHAMFLDTSYNSLRTVLSNIYSAFIESATKMWAYVRCLRAGKQPSTNLLIKTIQDLTELAFVLMKSKGRNRRNGGFTCAVSKRQVEWLALDAFQRILKKKQCGYLDVLVWLGAQLDGLEVKEGEMVRRLARVATAACH